MDTVKGKRIGTVVAKVYYASLPTDDMYLKIFSGQRSVFPHFFHFRGKRRKTFSAGKIPVLSDLINTDARV